MSTSTVPTNVGTTVRTAVQAGPAWIITEGIDAWLYDMNDRQFGVTVLLFMLIGSYIMPIIENISGRALMRAPVKEVPTTPRT